MCTHIYIHICIHISLHTYIHIHQVFVDYYTTVQSARISNKNRVKSLYIKRSIQVYSCIYVCIHKYAHTYTCICIYIYIHTYIFIHTYIYIPTYLHTPQVFVGYCCAKGARISNKKDLKSLRINLPLVKQYLVDFAVVPDGMAVSSAKWGTKVRFFLKTKKSVL